MDKQELRKIDAQIAEQVFGLKVRWMKDGPCTCYSGCVSLVINPIPFYTQNWDSALMVKDELENLGYKIHFRYDGDRDAKRARWTFFCKEVGRVDDYEGPLTICKGALFVMEYRNHQGDK